MLKYIITALVALELVLLSSFLSPAEAVINDTETYIWDYASLGSSELVCKQVIFHPQARPISPKEIPAQPGMLQSHIVNSSYCQGSTKPVSTRA